MFKKRFRQPSKEKTIINEDQQATDTTKQKINMEIEKDTIPEPPPRDEGDDDYLEIKNEILPFQVKCKECLSKKIFLISVTLTTPILLSLVCMSCGCANDLYLRQKINNISKTIPSYLG